LTGLAVAVVFVFLDGFNLAHWAVVTALVLLGLGVWLTMIRPSVNAHDDHILVRNALSDTTVPWHLVESVELRQVLVIRTEDKTVHGIAVGRTARQQLKQKRGGGSKSSRSPFSGGGFGGLGGSIGSGGPAGQIGSGPSGAPAGLGSLDYGDLVVARLDNFASTNRERSMGRSALDRRWRWLEAAAVAAVAVVFVVLVVLASS
jgi:hypothetical protein